MVSVSTKYVESLSCPKTGQEKTANSAHTWANKHLMKIERQFFMPQSYHFLEKEKL